MGENIHESCEFWQKAESVNISKEISEHSSIPWTGNSLGTSDAPFVTARSNAYLIALIGPANAGKTTILSSFYLQIGRGKKIANHQFNGSYTLIAWENIAHNLRWESGNPPSFPAHTTSGSGRNPGLLHLAFRYSDDKCKDLMFADAPGEWFSAWMTDKDALEATPAQWIVKHADMFLLVVDSEALSGSNRGATRTHYRQLIQRLAAERCGRPSAIVWSKADITVPTDIKKAIEERLNSEMRDAPQFIVSIDAKGQSMDQFVKLLEWILIQQRMRMVLPKVNSDSNDPFFMFGRS
jgi:hypothetical protein